MARLPADACQYERPFADDFSDCPAYWPRRFVPVTSLGDPLAAVWTCGNLGSHQASQGQFYARCGLGAAAARRRWRRGIGERRYAALRKFRRLTGEAIDADLAEVYAAAGLARGTPWTRGQDPGLDAAISRLMERVRDRLDSHRDLLEEIGLPPEPYADLTEEYLRFTLEHPDRAGQWQIPPDLLARFPPEAHSLFGL